MDVEDIQYILQTICPNGVDQLEECTIEANPGDLTLDKLQALHQLGIHRLSIGIQSFHDHLLTLIGRRHTASEAIHAVQLARTAGFANISVDLIYGLPTQTMEQWQADVQTALSLHPEHISCYCLSYEEDTPLTRMLEQGEITETDEDTENAMYDYLCHTLQAHGYEHYEVSNFALPGYHSRHNSSYWNDTPYIGLGAGAHSYDGQTRRSNRSDLTIYLADVTAVAEYEPLTPTDRYNEHVMLALRTSHGLAWQDIRQESHDYVRRQCERGLLRIENEHVIATQAGIHILNRIIEDLLI